MLWPRFDPAPAVISRSGPAQARPAIREQWPWYSWQEAIMYDSFPYVSRGSEGGRKPGETERDRETERVPSSS